MVVASAGLVATACGSSTTTSSPETASAATAGAPSPVDDADKQWTMQNKNQSATRYSSVNQINTETVKNLKVAWTFSTGVLRGHEGEPLVVGTTMYVHTPFPNLVYALDLTKEGAPVKWKYAPQQDSKVIPIACSTR
jgi:glucose dehydrogenase